MEAFWRFSTAGKGRKRKKAALFFVHSLKTLFQKDLS